MNHIDYARALLFINKQHREGEIDDDMSKKLHNFCKELHELWKEKQK